MGTYPTVSASRFDVVIDPDNPNNPHLGIRITPHDGDAFVVPIEYPWAKDLAEDILRTAYAHAPELFIEPIELPDPSD